VRKNGADLVVSYFFRVTKQTNDDDDDDLEEEPTPSLGCAATAIAQFSKCLKNGVVEVNLFDVLYRRFLHQGACTFFFRMLPPPDLQLK